MRTLLFAVIAMVAGVSFGQPELMPPIVCSGVTTSAVAVVKTNDLSVSGYVKGVQVAVSPAGGTCTVTVATSGSLTSRTLASGSFVGTSIVYPEYQSTTNGVLVPKFEDAFLASDKIIVSAVSATVSNDNLTVTVIPVIDRLQ